jgi:hypothetical protein
MPPLICAAFAEERTGLTQYGVTAQLEALEADR